MIIIEQYPCGGIDLCTVQAVHGKPFVGGDKWPVRTCWTVCRYDEIVFIQERIEIQSPAEAINVPQI